MAVTKINGARQIEASSILNAQQNFGTPSAATDVAIKSYVDSVAQGLDVKPSARVATVAALSPTNTYANGTSGLGATLTATGVGILTVDGVNLVLNDYVLVKNESTGANNGLYKVTTAGTAGVAYVLTRAIEMDTTLEYSGGFIFVEAGSTLASTGWVNTNSPAPTVGTTGITFTQFSGAGSFTGGTGITITGTSIAINTAVVMDLSSVQSASNKTFVAPVLGAATGTSLVLSSFINEAQGSNIASATTTDIGAATGNYVNVTGTTTITGLGTVQAGTRRIVNFNGILTLTYNASSLILPTSANITTAAGDTATFVSLGSGNWVCVQYTRRSGAALTGSASTTYQRSTVVSGTQDSANKVFTIANTVSTGSEQVFINGQLLMPGASNDYVYDGATTVTFQAGFTAPASTDVIRVYGTY